MHIFNERRDRDYLLRDKTKFSTEMRLRLFVRENILFSFVILFCTYVGTHVYIHIYVRVYVYAYVYIYTCRDIFYNICYFLYTHLYIAIKRCVFLSCAPIAAQYYNVSSSFIYF